MTRHTELRGDNSLKKKRMKRTPAKAKTVCFFSGIPLRIVGNSDGKKGLPKPTEKDYWMSPLIERLNKAYAQRQDEEYRICAEKTRDLQIKVESLKREVKRKEERRDELSAELAASTPSESALTFRFGGEERLPESGIRMRRLSEHNAQWGGKRAELAAFESFLRETHPQIASLNAEIDEVETDTRLLVERVRANTDARILVYYHSALKVHPQREIMPPCPRLTETNGESTYLSSRGAEPERIITMQNIRDLMRKGGTGSGTDE